MNRGKNSDLNLYVQYNTNEEEDYQAQSYLTQAFFSAFTANILRDTGFYAEINVSMEEQMFYGKGKGCEHVMDKCRTSRREYCNPETDYFLCDFYHHGSSKCRVSIFNDAG
ncbi:leishmanolysin family protein, putative [Ichthyophthirius multifiliis]|uniref:Leishmanolysin family protein, putative n=1 Tax=Ichthyophthirius multifiliis TaxID=5932 RepID=G0R6N2_ICHMU|nr:leishmanolysin family protein, putative [Ichthyophthirius multifiliis]EGR26873.1 leishmanolysin family protein, putative [Ichthyophthirius multifiliis]|eukprot:XP_004023757.1 leishmanolysin family protein, putative [Ichthyophthirius multifiliis]